MGKTWGLVTLTTVRVSSAQRLGHLLVNPERLEKGYKGTVAMCHGEGTGCSWKSPRRVITPRVLITHRESSPQSCSRVLSFLPLRLPLRLKTCLPTLFFAYPCDDLSLTVSASLRFARDAFNDGNGTLVWPVAGYNYLSVQNKVFGVTRARANSA